jgi:hypothetical protein
MSRDALMALVAKWRGYAVEWPSPDFAQAADELDAALAAHGRAPAPRPAPTAAYVPTYEDGIGWGSHARRRGASPASVWTGQMAGFAPAATDRTTTNSGDVGGPTEHP